MNPTLHIHLWTAEIEAGDVADRPVFLSESELTRARMLGSTATTSDRHFMALVLTAMALSPSTLRIYTGASRGNRYADRIYLIKCNY